MVCPYLEDVWELYLLGVLSGEDSQAAAEHLANGCAQCAERLRDAALTVYLLLQPNKPVQLKPKSIANLQRRMKRG